MKALPADMRITLFQMDIVWEDPASNLHKVETLAHRLKGTTEIIICPEMFNTGYTMNAHQFAESENGGTIAALTQMAEKTDMYFAGSMPFFKNCQYFNNFVLVGKKGLLFTYSKMHLFKYATEHQSYNAGKSYCDFKLNDLRIRPLICYDLRFPYCSFNDSDYDILIYVANWPVSRIDHWTALLRARAIENQCYVIGVNRTGTDQHGYQYPGKSVIFDFSGTLVNELEEGEKHFTFTPSIEAMYQYRQKLNFLSDRVR